MTVQIGKNRNSNDDVTVLDPKTLNSSTTITILGADPDRNWIYITNGFSDKACWIKLQAASVDNDKKGIFLNEKEKGITHWESPSKLDVTGEISAIADSGNPQIYITHG